MKLLSNGDECLYHVQSNYNCFNLISLTEVYVKIDNEIAILLDNANN